MPTRPKRLLFVITKSNFGGAQRYVFELAAALQNQGYTVAVACGGRAELVTRLETAGIPTYEIEGAERDLNVGKEVRFLRSLRSIMNDFQPDIVHLNSSKAGLWGALLARLNRVPRIVFTAHGWPFQEDRPLLWRTMAWLGSYVTGLLAHRIIVVSKNDHDRTPGILLKHKCTVIYPAALPFPLLPRDEARAALFSTETITEHAHHIWLVTHGELNHNKNHTTAIDAIAEFNSTHSTKIFYTIIGSGDVLPALTEQVELKGLTEYVSFLGYKSEARQFLLAFDLYLIPSLKEGLPYSLLEAGLAGLPCIASRVGGIPEVIINYETGLLIDPYNHMTIVAALDYLLHTTDARITYADELKATISNTFTQSEMIQRTRLSYEN